MPHRAPKPSAARNASADPVAASRRTRRTWLGLGLAGVVLSAGATAAVVALLEPPAPLRLVAIGADYATNLSLPHNTPAYNSLTDACRVRPASPGPWGGASLISGNDTPLVADERFRFADALAGVTEPTVVVLVALHGGADETGPYLLRENSQIGDPPTQRLRVVELLDALAGLPQSTNKVVVFEAATAPGDPRRGAGHNAFAEGLRSLEPRIAATPGLIVIATSDTGQRCWPTPNGRRSATLSAIAEALAGHGPDIDSDGRVSVAEAMQHTANTAEANASSVWRHRQSPLLLPEGAPGLRLARRIDLAPHAGPAPEPSHAGPAPDAKIAARWNRLESLAAELPAPETTAPLAWRRYRRALLRYEQVLLAGGTAQAGRLAPLLDDLEAVVRRDASAAGRLVDPVELNAANGAAPSSNEAVAKLLAATDAQLRPLVDRLFANDADGALRRATIESLLDYAQADPRNHLRRTANLIQALPAPAGLRPGAAHLVAMLGRGLPSDLSDPTWGDPLRAAIATRRLAEAALTVGVDESGAACVASSLPWLADRIDEADRPRREGEDWLFGGAEFLPRASAALQSAHDSYVTLTDDSQAVRAALAARDRALDLLPFYGETVAAIPDCTVDSPAQLEAIVVDLESAWASAHTLADALEGQDRVDPNASIAALGKLRNELQSDLDQLGSALTEWRAELLTRTGAAARSGREAALLSPDIAVGERMRLIAAAPAPDSTPDSAAGRPLRLDASRQAAWHASVIRRRLRAALAAVGPRLYDRGTSKAGAFIHDAQTITADAGESAPDAAERVAKRVASAWRAATIAQLEKPGAVTADAVEAARRLDWGLVIDAGESVLAAARRQSLCDYYLWRARRVLDDDWAADDPNGEPYAAAAAKAYLSLAERVIPGQSAVDQLLRRANDASPLAITAPARIDSVDGVAPPVLLTVTAPGREGLAAVSIVADDAAGEASRRCVCNVASAEPTLSPAIDTLDTSSSRVRFVAWRRGHVATADTPVALHAKPTIEIIEPPAPRAAALAVLADRSLNGLGAPGAVSFVLDASGSMGRTTGATTSKYEQALAELRSLLADTPRGVWVSVWVFGQAQGPGKTVDPAEAAIERLVDPVQWDPDDAGLLDRITRPLAYPRVEPWNESALARAILTASSDLANRDGYKAVIAVTDGVDNRFAEDKLANPLGESLGQVLSRELPERGVALHVIGFRLPGAEQEPARRQFDFASGATPRGGYWQADHPQALSAALRTAWSGGENAWALAAAAPDGRRLGEAVLSPAGSAPVWPDRPLPLGWYTLPIGRAEAASQRALLAAGDLLLVRLGQPEADAPLSVASATRLLWPAKPSAEAVGWRAAILNRRLLPNDATSATVALENLPAASPTSVLQITRPSRVWFERTCVDRQGATLSWRRVDGYPAPAWELHGEGGASPACPEGLRVWWTAEEPAADAKVADFDSIDTLIGASWDIDGRQTTLLGLAAENRPLADGSGRVVEQPCVVVRLKGARCFVRLGGVAPAGQRHAFYDDAEQTVAVFWPVTPHQLEHGLRWFELASVQSMKEAAKASGATIHFPELGPASPGDLRPAPSVGWFDSASL